MFYWKKDKTGICYAELFGQFKAEFNDNNLRAHTSAVTAVKLVESAYELLLLEAYFADFQNTYNFFQTD